jgi:sugar lactone lactonase YvrE
LAGATATLSVAVAGNGPFTYQWQLNGANLPGTITTAAGNGTSGYSGDGRGATNAALNLPYGVAAGPLGDLYVADSGNNVVRRMGTDGVISTFAGNGSQGFAGDGGAATNGSLNGPNQLAVDASGNLYIADTGNNRIRKVDTQGNITTIAGDGTAGYSGDSGPATNASLRAPFGVAVDSSGNVFISDSGNHRVRNVGPSGVIQTVAGDGVPGFTADGGLAVDASLNSPGAIAVDGSENLFIADTLNNRVRQVNVFGAISTVAGNGLAAHAGDGGPASGASVKLPLGVAVDAFGDLYIAEAYDNVVRQVSAAGVISTVAGDGAEGYSGDGGAPTNASLAFPTTLAAGPSGALFVADSANNRVREVALATLPALTIPRISEATAGDYQVIVSNASGSVTSAVAVVAYGVPNVITSQPASQTALAGATVALQVGATGLGPLAYQWQFNGAAIPVKIYTIAGGGASGVSVAGRATNASLLNPSAVAVGPAGDIYFSDTDHHVIRKVDTNGNITTIAGNGGDGFSGDGGLAVNATLTYPSGLAVDPSGNLYFADVVNNRVRKVATNGVITTFAGSGASGSGFSGDGGMATKASLSYPVAVAVNPAGEVFIADPNYNVALKVDTRGIITRVAGTGQRGYTGDGGFATNASLNQPFAVAVDSAGNVYVADSYNYRIRKVDTNAVIRAIAGTGTQGHSGMGGLATSASIGDVDGLVVDASGNLFFTEYDNNRVEMVDSAGVFTTIAGNGNTGYSGDGGPAGLAEFNQPDGMAMDAAGHLYIAERNNGVIRELTLSDQPELTVENFSAASAGAYQVVVSGPSGSVTSAVATVTVGYPLIAATLQSGSSILLQSDGVPNAYYFLQAATNLAPPVNWRAVATNAADASGNWSHIDTGVNTRESRFYRLLSP